MTNHAARAIRPAAWIVGLVPLALLVYRAATGGLTANPIEDVTHRTGFAALTLLMAALAVTPARRLTGWNTLAPVRRTFGLLAFFYAAIHFVTYLFDQAFSLGYIVEDVIERPWVTVGFAALVLLVPLAVTSTRGWIRRLGKRWQKLHRLVYVAAGLAVLHHLLLVKQDLRQPLIFAAVFAVLMALRLTPRRARKQPPPPRETAAATAP
jgi:methionine sulfoxide reductase heme-binding subunit